MHCRNRSEPKPKWMITSEYVEENEGLPTNSHSVTVKIIVIEVAKSSDGGICICGCFINRPGCKPCGAKNCYVLVSVLTVWCVSERERESMLQ